MIFGPFSLNLDRLKIDNLQITIEAKINHFWGKNGVGKSTLMNLIIQELEKSNISFCYINQNYRQNWFWWLTVRENLELAMNSSSNQYYHYSKIEQLPEYSANKSWLEPLIELNSKQIDFSKNNELDSISLSGGQLQRVLLFRELMLKPKFVFLDEAFSALDKKITTELINWLLMEQKKENFTIISISHSPEIIQQMPGQIFELSQNETKLLQIHKISKLTANI